MLRDLVSPVLYLDTCPGKTNTPFFSSYEKNPVKGLQHIVTFMYYVEFNIYQEYLDEYLPSTK